MPQLLRFQEKELCPVWRQASVTVDADVAMVRCSCPAAPCHGFKIDAMPLTASSLQQHLAWATSRMIERLGIRGYQHNGDEIVVHGPTYSYQLDSRTFDPSSSLWAEAKRRGDPSLVLPFVFEMDTVAPPPLRDYILWGRFFAFEWRVRSNLSESGGATW